MKRRPAPPKRYGPSLLGFQPLGPLGQGSLDLATPITLICRTGPSGAFLLPRDGCVDSVGQGAGVVTADHESIPLRVLDLYHHDLLTAMPQ